MNEEDKSLISLASNNQDLKNNIAIIFTKLETMELNDIEDQVSTLMINMMNFFSNNVEEIPSFDNLTSEQKKIILMKFKKVAHNLKNKHIKTVDEMLQTFVFTVLSNIGERVEYLEAVEIINEKNKESFKTFLRKAIDEEVDNITHNKEIEANQNFIHDSVLFGVRETMEKIGLKISSKELDNEAIEALEQAHKKLQYSIVKGK